MLDLNGSGDRLVADDSEAREVLDNLRPVKHLKGDVFEGRPRENVPEEEKPTPAQKRARAANIEKAQEARKQRKSAA